MRFTDYLFNEVKDIWKSYLNHPFVNEIGEGTLPKEKFKRYLIQDYLYLKEFSRVFAMGMVKADTIKEMKFFNKAANGSIEDEAAIHIEYMKRLGVAPIVAEKCKLEMVSSSYISYMQAVSLTGGVKEIVMATLPCNWSYNYIGHYLYETYKDNLEGNYYKDWIKMYADNEFDEILKEWLEYTNHICKNLSEEEIKKLTEIFVKSSLYELDFWNMGYEEVNKDDV
ncbi:thiaminase II [Paraclostridium tenue]|uniref:Aminopyrimidine aminohydrolase n=1 Tax=Paeniclostridium hominis TaxID=2764329 RepID=A0ABR7K0A7_9FIRM|nr:thiaminase II [Paeniclostridium hominis]